MKKMLLLAVAIFFASIFSSCQYGLNFWQWARDDVDNRWNSKSDAYTDLGNFLTVEKDEYTFLLFSDIHYGKTGFPETDQLLKFLDDYAKKNPTDPLRFVVCLGDIAEKGTFDEIRNYHNFEPKVMEKIKAANKSAGTLISEDEPRLNRIVTILGNHDLYNEGFDIWRLQTYPGTPGAKFTVTTKNGKTRSFYNMDSASSAFGSYQFNFFDSKLRGDENSKFILTHEPLHQMGTPLVPELVVSFVQKDRLKMIQLLLETNVDFYFSGHVHSGGDYDWEEFKEFSFKSYTECQGDHCFYTVTVNEEEKTVKIDRYKNIYIEEPDDITIYRF